jgi:hypothetical protein
MFAIEDIEDLTNLTGLSSLVNKTHTDDKLDLEQIEKSMIGDGGIKIIAESDPTREFENTIRELAVDTGISLDDFGGKPIAPSVEEDSYLNTPPRTYTAPITSTAPAAPTSSSANMEEFLERDDFLPDYENAEYPEYPEHPEHYEPKPSNSRSSYSYHKARPEPPRSHPLDLDYRPHRSQSEDYLDEALRTYSGGQSDVSVEREREEDLKATLLEDIDELISELSSETPPVDLSRIPKVNQDSPLDLVKKVHKILRMKYDRRRCNTLGSEVILAGAQGLGYICDGKRKIGPFCPNLEGWHNTVRPKLRRMKYETSTIVSNIMQEYNMGPVTRVLLELIPSAFLYSNMRRENHNQATYTPDQMSQAFDDLRQFDDN